VQAGLGRGRWKSPHLERQERASNPRPAPSTAPTSASQAAKGGFKKQFPGASDRRTPTFRINVENSLPNQQRPQEPNLPGILRNSATPKASNPMTRSFFSEKNAQKIFSDLPQASQHGEHVPKTSFHPELLAFMEGRGGSVRLDSGVTDDSAHFLAR